MSIGIFDFFQKMSILVVEHAVAVALEVRIGDLLPEFFADALVFLGAFQAAGAVAAGVLQALFYSVDHVLVGVEMNSHVDFLLGIVKV